jgi:hypothetical protein
MKAHEKALHALTDALGDDHDRAVLEQTPREEGLVDEGSPEARELHEVVARRRKRCLRDVWPVAGLVYAERRKDFVTRLAHYWTAASRGLTPASA